MVIYQFIVRLLTGNTIFKDTLYLRHRKDKSISDQIIARQGPYSALCKYCVCIFSGSSTINPHFFMTRHLSLWTRSKLNVSHFVDLITPG